jgi:hypothetical protein
MAVLKEVLYMLRPHRPHVPETYLWILLWCILALLLLMAEAALLPQTTLAMVNQIKETLHLFFLQASQFSWSVAQLK